MRDELRPRASDTAGPYRPGVIAVLAVFAGLAVWLIGGFVGYSEPPSRAAGAGGAGGPVATSGVAASDDVRSATSAPDSERATDAAPAAPADAPVRGTAALVDPVWAAERSARTGIPLRALLGYAGADLALRAEAPRCGLGWTTLAAIGHLESGHGTHGGSALDADGVARPAILGPGLDGGAYARVDDTDGGALDGTSGGDRAVGPMQFIPSTWAAWGADGSGDGVADPQQIDDAALAAGRYLCHAGDLTEAGTWRAAVYSYNHVDAYVDAVAVTADDYAGRARG